MRTDSLDEALAELDRVKAERDDAAADCQRKNKELSDAEDAVACEVDGPYPCEHLSLAGCVKGLRARIERMEADLAEVGRIVTQEDGSLGCCEAAHDRDSAVRAFLDGRKGKR